MNSYDYTDIILPTIRMYSEIDAILDEYAKSLGIDLQNKVSIDEEKNMKL